MYVTAGKDIIALEPETAKVIWRYTAPATVSRRGVAYWPGDRDTPPRLFKPTADNAARRQWADVRDGREGHHRARAGDGKSDLAVHGSGHREPTRRRVLARRSRYTSAAL